MEFHDLMLWARDFLAAVTEQDRGRLRGFFTPGAAVYWPNTGEKFSLEEYLTANCEYPGQWRGSSCGRRGRTPVRWWPPASGRTGDRPAMWYPSCGLTGQD